MFHSEHVSWKCPHKITKDSSQRKLDEAITTQHMSTSNFKRHVHKGYHRFFILGIAQKYHYQLYLQVLEQHPNQIMHQVEHNLPKPIIDISFKPVQSIQSLFQQALKIITQNGWSHDVKIVEGPIVDEKIQKIHKQVWVVPLKIIIQNGWSHEVKIVVGPIVDEKIYKLHKQRWVVPLLMSNELTLCVHMHVHTHATCIE